MTRTGIIWLLTLFAFEGIAVIAAFQIVSPIECRATGMEGSCRALRAMFISALCMVAGFEIFVFARKKAWRRFVDMVQETKPWSLWTVVHGAGGVTIFLPLLFIPRSDLNKEFLYVFIPLLVGAALLAFGGAFWVLRPRSWWRWLRSESFQPVFIILLAATIPFLAVLIEPLWTINFMTSATFRGVAALLSAASGEVLIDPVHAWIGLPGFVVVVASQCSGIEGFALITGFMAIYAILFRDTLRQRAFWLALWPIALLVSWVFNILRITALILLGKYVSPDLAVNGFHSFAGWLLFTFLGLGVLLVAQLVPGLHQGNFAPRGWGRLSADPIAALIFPFIAFMISGVVVQAFWEHPALGYPFQLAIMVGVVFWLRDKLFQQIRLSLDPISIAIGLVVGIGWVWFSVGTSDSELGVQSLGKTALIVWALFRTLGTTIFVPLIEEAFFRGYVLARLDTGSPAAKAVAIAVSTGLFAALHGRVLLAGIAGLLFAAAMLRRKRLGDAVVAHIVANTTVAAAAWFTGEWSLI